MSVSDVSVRVCMCVVVCCVEWEDSSMVEVSEYELQFGDLIVR